MSNYNKNNKRYICMRDYKVKREIPFKDKKKGKILNCNPIDLLVVFNTKNQILYLHQPINS